MKTQSITTMHFVDTSQALMAQQWEHHAPCSHYVTFNVLP